MIPQYSDFRSHRAIVLMTALALCGCMLDHPATPTKARTASIATPRPVLTPGPLNTPAAVVTPPVTVLLGAASLTGKVKLYVDAVSTASDAIVSNHGGGLISEHGGAVVSNNAGNLIANNGGGLGGKTFFTLTATAERHEAALAEAEITVEDAAGKAILDAAGRPLTATTDRSGTYALHGTLPSHGVVLRVKLWNGGELVALAPHVADAGRAQPIDTSTTLGADYVLDRYVKGDQQKLDLLPAAESDKLHTNLDAASLLLLTVPSYHAADAVTLTESLRAKAPNIDLALTEIHDLMYGQLHHGDGRQGTAIATYGPTALLIDDAGNLVFGEPQFGRLRQIAADGTVSTLADAVQGKFHKNFPQLKDAVRAADGSLYIATPGQVVHLKLDGAVETVAGVELALPGATATPGPTATLRPGRVALGPDGTLYIGETIDPQEKTPPRVYALKPGGALIPIVIDAGWTTQNNVNGLACGADGSLYVLARTADADHGKLYKRSADGTVSTLASDLSLIDVNGCLRIGNDGTLYVSEIAASRVSAVAPDGTHHVVAGKGGPAASADLVWPESMAVGKDGTLYVADVERNTINTLATDGTWRVVVGAPAGAPTDLANLALNGPGGGVFDEQGRLLVVQRGGHNVVRFDGKTVATVAGTGHVGTKGDGGPAALAEFAYPAGLTYQAGTTYIGESSSHRIRKIGPDGIVSSAILGPDVAVTPLHGLSPDDRPLFSAFATVGDAIAVAPDGRMYWSNRGQHQVYRLALDGHVELVAGVAPKTAAAMAIVQIGPQQEVTGPAKEAVFGAPIGLVFDAHGDLYIADAGSLLIRKVTGLDGNAPVVSRYAGTSSYEAANKVTGADEGFKSALLLPAGLAIDKAGNMYVSELGTKSVPLLTEVSDGSLGNLLSAFTPSFARVRKITPDGHVTVIAGPGTQRFGDPQAADGLVLPLSLAVATDGRLAIVDAAANLVHILPAGSF
jgi:sugar lactone lactonase YvrE